MSTRADGPFDSSQDFPPGVPGDAAPTLRLTNTNDQADDSPKDGERPTRQDSSPRNTPPVMLRQARAVGPLVCVLCADPDRRLELVERMQAMGVRCREAGSARELAILREALHAGRGDTLDAVVMDDELPDASAPDLAQVLKWQRVAVVPWVPGTPAAAIAGRVFASLAGSRPTGTLGLRAVTLTPKDGRTPITQTPQGQEPAARAVDLVQAYEEFALHMNQLTTANEYGALIRSELDIESLLRSTLEFLLGRTGPTNAAVFLPTTTGDFSLGAYVNYDCPRETVDILLDHMANVIAPRFEDLRAVAHLNDAAALDRYIGADADWLGESGVMAVACRAERETLAIILLFRDRHIPFSSGLGEQLQTVADLFGRQLSRVIHIHHRHLPKHKWGLLGDQESGDDYGDLAA